MHKELGTHEAKRAMTEENVTESVRKILETEENMALYKSQVNHLFFYFLMITKLKNNYITGRDVDKGD